MLKKMMLSVALFGIAIASAKTYHITLGEPYTVGSQTLKPGDYNLVVNGGTLDIQGHDQSAGAVTLTSGSINGAGTLTAPSFLVQNGTAAAHLAGPGALTKSGGGVATLNGNNSYAGPTTVNGGTLSLTGNNTYAGATVINNGGTVVVSADASLGAAHLALNPGGTLRVDGTTSFACARNLFLGTAAWAWDKARVWVHIIRRRRSHRSDQTPPRAPNTRMGNWLEKPSRPRTRADSVSR